MGVNDIIPISTKKSGRPRKFDENQALDAAVEVFWLHGYDGASLDELTNRMGINRPSLYGAFGDKKALYLRALKHYAEGIGSKAMQAFLSEPDIRTAVENMFAVSLQCQIRGGPFAKGCLLANCAPATLAAVPETQSFLRDVSTRSHAYLVERFAVEMAAGKLPPGFPKQERAILLLDLVQAQAYRARIGDSGESLQSAIGCKVSAILSN